MRKNILFFTIIICFLLSGTVAYAGQTVDVKGNVYIKDLYKMTLGAVKEEQSIKLFVELAANNEGYSSPDKIKKVQVKLIDNNGINTYTGNFFDIPLYNGMGVINIDGLYNYDKIQVRALLETDRGIENETLDAEQFGIQVNKLPAPVVTSIEAADTGNGAGINSGDTITIKFDMNTNQPPAASKSDIDNIIDFGSGKSLGANYSGTWTDPQALAVKILDPSGSNIAVGDIIAIKQAGSITNTDGTSEACTGSYAIGGTFGDNKVAAVLFNDPNLEYAVRKALNIPQGDITNIDMANLTRLVVSGRQVKDITGLEYAVNLNVLYLSGNMITDISPLGNLQKLTELYIDDNGVENISALASLQSLRFLGISQNIISDISHLGSLIGLQKLDVSYNKISDIQALKDSVNLQELNLSFNNITDVSALGSLVKLSSLNLSSNSISNINSLAGLNGLTSLSIQKNQCVDISPVKYLVNLQYLNSSENNIGDISSLGGLVNLSKLYIASNSITDVYSLAGLGNIDTLDISSNPVSDISALGNIMKLNSLKLDSTNVSDITPIKGLNNLQSLYMSRCKITDISSLGALSNLYTLVLSDNSVSDISPLQGLNNLRWLNISGNQIANLTPLVINSQSGGVGSGDYLDITNNQFDLNGGSKDMNDIQILINNGVIVKYLQ